ncbi:MAG: hypothetical protein HY329_08625, partial [Chloroflexi bacterium]|nr:hypothetical protein [Chloroflexota bacterium]
GVGLAVGMMFPTTHTENELLGETRDQLLEQAKSFASTTGEKLQDIAGEVQQTVQRESQAQGLTGTSTSSDTRSTTTF